MKNKLDKYLEYAERINAINNIDIRQKLFELLLNEMTEECYFTVPKEEDVTYQEIIENKEKQEILVSIIRKPIINRDDYCDIKLAWKKAVDYVIEYPAFLGCKNNYTVYIESSDFFDIRQDSSDPFYFLKDGFKEYVKIAFNSIEVSNNAIAFIVGGIETPNSVMVMFVRKEWVDNPTELNPKFIDLPASRTYL